MLTCLLIGFLVLNGFLIGTVFAKGKPPDTKPPPKVKGVVITVVPEGNALELDWEKVRARDLDHYNIYRSTIPGFIPDLENPDATSQSHHYLDTDLTDGVTYYYRVAAVDRSNNIGEPSDEASGTPADTVAPEKVVGVEVANVPGGGQLELTWTASTASDLDHYNIYRSTIAGFIPSPSNLVASPTANNYLDTGLTDGITYYYRITALDEVPNEGPASDEASGVPGDDPPPEQVTGLTITTVPTGNTLDLGWSASAAPDLDHYNVYRSITSGFTPGPAYLIATPVTNFYTDTGLTDGTVYYYRVSAVDQGSNEGIPSDEGSGVPMDIVPPEKVLGLTVTVMNATGDQLYLSWNFSMAPDLDHFNVYRSTTPGFIPGPSNLIATPTMNFYLDTGLTEGVTYYYRVSALDEVPNEGPPSDEASGTP